MIKLLPPYPHIHEELRKGMVIPFLGSGASLGNRQEDSKWEKDRSAYLPNATELAEYLARMTMFPKNEPRELAKVAEYYCGVSGRSPLNQELQAIFNSPCGPTMLHFFLADIPAPLLIVTTNYDDLIERAFKEKNRKYDLVIHTTDLQYSDRILWWPYGHKEPRAEIANVLDIDLQETTVIYKIHGTIDRDDPHRSQYVITESDYIDFVARMTKNSAIPAIFGEPFEKLPFLFLGYGLYDWNLRVVLSRIEKDMQRRKEVVSWAIQHSPSPLEQFFWRNRGVQVYDMMIEEFVKGLTEY